VLFFIHFESRRVAIAGITVPRAFGWAAPLLSSTGRV